MGALRESFNINRKFVRNYHMEAFKGILSKSMGNWSGISIWNPEGAPCKIGSPGELLPRTPGASVRGWASHPRTLAAGGARVRGCEARSGNSCLAPLVRGCEGEPRTPAPGVPSRCNGTDCDGANFQNAMHCTSPNVLWEILFGIVMCNH